jgi:hypothetical protein
MRTMRLGWVIAVMFASGCAGSGAATAPVANVETVAAVAPPAPGPSFEADAPARSVAARAAPEPTPSERPGLGTAWGETRVSYIHDVDFVRSSEGHPFAVTTLHYNDRNGVLALAAYRSGGSPRWQETAAGGAITVSVQNEENEPLEGFVLGDKNYVIGEPGERYSIVSANNTDHRFEAVATVDGVDVMSGSAGSTDNRGYVLAPYQTMTIDGFRQSQSRVAAFRFSKVRDSYAAETGRARNVGVIGIAFFDERGDAFSRGSPRELHLRDTANPFPENEHRYAEPPPGRW